MSKKIIIADIPVEEAFHYAIGLQTSLLYYQVAYYFSHVLAIDLHRYTHQKIYYDGQEIWIDYYIAEKKNDRFFLLSRQNCTAAQASSAQWTKINYFLSIFSETAIAEYKISVEEQHHFFILPIEFSSTKIRSFLSSINDYGVVFDTIQHPNYPLI